MQRILQSVRLDFSLNEGDADELSSSQGNQHVEQSYDEFGTMGEVV